MIIKGSEISNGVRQKIKNWLCEELLSSLTTEVIVSGRTEKDLIYDVKLLVNGIELEPVLLNRLYNGIEEIIDREAEILANNKLADALADVNSLTEVIKEAEYKIREKFNIIKDEE